MRQLTLRVDDALAERLKDAASERRQSVNSFAQSVLSAAVDPQFADGESARVRERLARAGILAATGGTPSTRLSAPELALARAAAGRGESSLADLVSEGRD